MKYKYYSEKTPSEYMGLWRTDGKHIQFRHGDKWRSSILDHVGRLIRISRNKARKMNRAAFN
jgi:hypothetical protein